MSDEEGLSRRSADRLADSRFTDMGTRISALEAAMNTHVEWTKREYNLVMSRTHDLEVAVKENTGLTQRNNDLTQEIRDVIVAGRTGLKVLGSVGTAVKWVASVAAAIVTIWGLIWLLLHPGAIPPK